VRAGREPGPAALGSAPCALVQPDLSRHPREKCHDAEDYDGIWIPSLSGRWRVEFVRLVPNDGALHQQDPLSRFLTTIVLQRNACVSDSLETPAKSLLCASQVKVKAAQGRDAWSSVW
jgi:hypothetical protein